MKKREHFIGQILNIVIIKVWVHINICMVLWKVWRMDGATHALWNTEEFPVVPAMISGTRASSMLSTRGMGAGWGRESSESAPAEEDDAPASSPTATSSMPSREPGDSSSPDKITKFTLILDYRVYTVFKK